MNLKALSFGAVLGFIVAVVPSCGSNACGPQNCDGCCDAMSKCVPQSASNSNVACGRQGVTCANCSSMAQACNPTSFVCESPASVGGGNGGGSMGGGTGGGMTGGGTGTGGGTTGGGTGTGGGTTGGGGGGLVTGCSIGSQNCRPGESCMYSNAMGATSCFPGVCDVVTQNCPTASEKCSYAGFADGGTGRVCAPAGNIAEGQACAMGSDLCARGLVCISGTCAKYCYQTSNCTAATNGQCVGVVQIGGTAELPTTCINIASCDPLLQNCPMTAQACSLTQSGPGCIQAGNVAIGASCTMGNCVKGAVCIGDQTAANCRAFCNLDGGMPACATGACNGVANAGGMPFPFGACQ